MTQPTLTYILPDKVGGVFSYVQNLLAHSRSSQFETHVILTHGKRDADTRSSGRLRAHKVTIFEHDLPGENVYAVLRRLFRLLAPGPGVLVTNDWLELAMLSVNNPDKMVVNITHGDWKYYYDLVEKHEAVIDVFVTPALVIAEKLRSAVPSRHDSVRYIPHGVDIPHSGRSSANSPLRVIFVGRFTSQKCPTMLPLIDRELHRRGIDVNWVVVGSGPEEDIVRADWKWNQSVRWTGEVPKQRVLDLYQSQDVFLLPSHLEGFPVTLMEGGAAGLVPVVSDLQSGIPEVVIQGETGYRVSIGDVAGFASALEELNRDRGRLDRMSMAVRRLVAEKFDIRRNAAEYDSLYARFEELRRPRVHCRLHYGSRLDKPWLPNAFVRTVRSILGPRAY